MQVCTVCRHPERLAIEAALVRHTPFRKIGEQFRVGYTAVVRHQKHIVTKLSKAREGIEMADATTLLGKVDQVIRDAQRITAKAEKDGDLSTALQGLRTITNSLALLGRVTGEIAQANSSIQFHSHQHLTVNAAPMGEAELDLEIARQVGEATLGFDEQEIARLKALVSAPPMMLEGKSELEPKVPDSALSDQ